MLITKDAKIKIIVNYFMLADPFKTMELYLP